MKYLFINKKFKIAFFLLICLSSLVMIITSIVNLAQGSNSGIPTIMFQVLCGVVLIVVSIASIGKIILYYPKKLTIANVVTSAFVAAAGLFILVGDPAAIQLTIAYLVPSFILCFGAFLIVKAIVDIVVNKQTNKPLILTKFIFAVASIILGILLIVFVKEANNGIWLMLGILILAYSIYYIVVAMKVKDNVIENNVGEKSSTDGNKSDNPSK